MKCKNCGANLQDNATFCGECGAPVENQQNVQQNNYTPNQQNVQYANQNNYNPNQQNVNADGVSEQEINDGKVMAVLAYLGFLLIIPAIAANKNKFVRFHLGQGLILFIASVIGGFLSFIPFIDLKRFFAVCSAVLFLYRLYSFILYHKRRRIAILEGIFVIICVENATGSKITAKSLQLRKISV